MPNSSNHCRKHIVTIEFEAKFSAYAHPDYLSAAQEMFSTRGDIGFLFPEHPVKVVNVKTLLETLTKDEALKRIKSALSVESGDTLRIAIKSILDSIEK